jgi:hypothetical protein
MDRYNLFDWEETPNFKKTTIARSEWVEKWEQAEVEVPLYKPAMNRVYASSVNVYAGGGTKSLARSDGASGDVHYFTRARYPCTTISQLPQSSFHDRDERTGSYNPESESADIVRAVILLMGGAAAENLVLKKCTKDGSTRFAEGKEIVEFGYDLRFGKEMPLRIRLCSVRGTMGWPCLDKTDENLDRCFDVFLSRHAQVAFEYSRRHPSMDAEDVADSFWVGFSARTRQLYWNYRNRRELFDRYDPHLYGDYRFPEQWSFVLWALERQDERLGALAELFHDKFRALAERAAAEEGETR